MVDSAGKIVLGSFRHSDDENFSDTPDNIPAHDAEAYTYSGSNVTLITYTLNGATVATVAMTYDGSNNVLTRTRAS